MACLKTFSCKRRAPPHRFAASPVHGAIGGVISVRLINCLTLLLALRPGGHCAAGQPMDLAAGAAFAGNAPRRAWFIPLVPSLRSKVEHDVETALQRPGLDRVGALQAHDHA